MLFLVSRRNQTPRPGRQQKHEGKSCSMPKYAIAFVAPTDGKALKHRIVESPDTDSALKMFFKEEVSEFYSDNEQGYHYFREDFYDDALASGSIVQLD